MSVLQVCEDVERINKRVEANDAFAIYNLGCFYHDGTHGLQQDYERANELWLQAGELGSIYAYNDIAAAYYDGEGVERDVKKEIYYLELAAMGGDATARHNLGCVEEDAGNMNRAMKHWIISAGAGDDVSLKKIREGYLNGAATKDDFETALRAHKEAKDEEKSDQREAAAAFYGQN